MCLAHNNDDYPSPQEELGIIMKSTQRCAFRIKGDYKRWFDKSERKTLHKAGFQLVKYKIPRKHVVIGSKQVVFKNSKGIRVESFNCRKTHLTSI